ncbi:MAG: hypothetical protein DHS20C14_00510 [Phycisphaeraceae bacterium]|nr:MAG: hypothetical protein DHS20C14_00510 [Phycisphaeraceae bacterium]
MQQKAKAGAGIGTVVLVVAIIALRMMGGSGSGTTASTPPGSDTPRDAEARSATPRAADPTPTSPTPTADDGGAAEIDRLYQSETSDVFITIAGRVDRILPDDNEGSRHQKFIVKLSSGQTILIAHNIDLAPRVPLDRGDQVRLHGEYEWTNQGGTIHWTHHDPDGYRSGGWIEHDGNRYE